MDGPVITPGSPFTRREPSCKGPYRQGGSWHGDAREKQAVGWGGQNFSSSPQSPMTSNTSRHCRSPRTPGYGSRNYNSRPSTLSVDDLVYRIRRLPARESVASVAAGSIPGLDSRAVAALLKELAKTGNGHRAHEFFDYILGLGDRHEAARLCDVFTYTAAISICNNDQQLDRALQLSADMQKRNVPRNVHTHSALMNVCIKCGQLRLALECWENMQRDAIEPNVVTYNTLIDVYGKLGRWEDALQVLQRMKAQGVPPVTRTYNTLMIACNTSGQWQHALEVHKEMRTAGHMLNTTSYNALISAHSKSGHLDQVLSTYRSMVEEGCERSVITYSSLISACEKAGDWKLALEFFEECTKDNCRPNVITFNSLISACSQGGQWEKARDLFELMQQQGCTPDVVTYTALISAFERGGKWQLALQAFQAMQSKGCKPDSIVYNAIIDALWDTGIGWAQQHAALLYRRATAAGYLRRAAHASPGYLELCLHTLTTGVAVLSLFTWLTDLQQKVVQEGADALPGRVVIVTGKSRSKEDEAGTAAKEAVVAVLSAARSPFQSISEAAACAGRLEAPGKETAEWLAGGCGGLDPAARCALGQEMSPEGVAQALADIEAAAARVESAFAAIRAFEDAHPTNFKLMPPLYLECRSDCINTICDLAQRLHIREEVGHDAVQLLDRAMMAPEGAAADAMCAAAPASLYLAVCQDTQHSRDALPLLSAISNLTGYSVDMLGQIKESLAGALQGDTAAISPQRCISLYLERLGSISEASAHRLEGLACLAKVVAQSQQAGSVRPSLMAASLLAADRQAHGDLPPWPSCLQRLTGYAPGHLQDLVNAHLPVLRGAEELGAYKSRIEQLGASDTASPRGGDDIAPSWPCTPSNADHRSSPAPGLFRSLSFTPTGMSTPGAGGMHPGAQSPGSAFRRVNSSCNAFGGIPQSPMSGRSGSRAAFGEPGSRAGFGAATEHPMSYPASPAARTINRRWSFSGAPHGSNHGGFSSAAQKGYNERLQALQRQQSLALNQLQQASLSREDSFLGAAELLQQAAASMPSPHGHGLHALAFGGAPGFDTALNSPMTPQPQAYKPPIDVTQRQHMQAFSEHMPLSPMLASMGSAGPHLQPGLPSDAAADAEAMWHLSNHLNNLQLHQTPLVDHNPEPASWHSAELASSLLGDRRGSSGGGGPAPAGGPGFGMLPHCESAPGDLFQQELAALRKLSGPPEGAGADLLGAYSASLENMYPGIGDTVCGSDYIQRYLQLLCAQEGTRGPGTP